MVQETNVEANLNRFWDVEAIEHPMTPEQHACEHHFVTTTTNQSDGRFIVRLPVKGNPNQLGTSRRSADSRLLAIEHRLAKNPELKHQYHHFMQESEELGHTEPVASADALPHVTICHTMQFLKKPVLLQKHVLCSTEVPKRPTVYHSMI
jgi:hypothetical protein